MDKETKEILIEIKNSLNVIASYIQAKEESESAIRNANHEYYEKMRRAGYLPKREDFDRKKCKNCGFLECETANYCGRCGVTF